MAVCTKKEFSRQELQDMLDGVKTLSMEELSEVFGGRQWAIDPLTGNAVTGDDRKHVTHNQRIIEESIFGSRMYAELSAK